MRQSLFGKSRKQLIAICLIAIMILGVNLCLDLNTTVYGAQPRKVKVAFFPMDGYNVTLPDGSFTGMDVKYLQAMSKYSYWDVEYVPCDSWDEALELLEKKQVDLVGSAQFSKERADRFEFANLPSGYTFGTIAVNSDSDIAYEDFLAMKDITFGVVKTYIRKSEFIEYIVDNGIENPKIVEFDTTQELKEALNQGKIDAMVHTFTELSEGQRIVGRFAPYPFYYISYKGNDDLMMELNQTIADLKLNYPILESTLLYEFYQSKLDQSIVLSTEEKNYIQEKGTLKVGYLDGFYPFSYEKDGRLEGLCKAVIDDLAYVTGFSVEYIKMDSVTDAEKALTKKKIDILCYSALTEEYIIEKNLVRTSDYATIPTVLIMHKNENLDSLRSLAVVEDLMSEAEASLSSEDMNMVIYETQQKCMEAVLSGEVDAAICDGYLTEYLLGSMAEYKELEIKSVLNIDHEIGMVLSGKDSRVLTQIVEKVVSPISDKQVSEYIIQDNVFSAMTVSDFIKKYSNAIIGVLIMLMLLLITFVIHIIRSNKRIQKLMYKDYEMNIWNLNYLTYQASEYLLGVGKAEYALVSINVSQFRLFNTLYGWKAGQKLLDSIVEELSKAVVSQKDIYARDKGDHFVLFLAYDSKQELIERMKKLQNQIAERIYSDTDNRMAITMGIYFIPTESRDLQAAISNANQAMESLHGNTDNEIQVYDEELENKLKAEHQREKLLKSVDIQKDFVAYYQAKVDIRTEEIIGAEALVRFLDPSANGAVRAPYFFVPYYEKTGKITEVDFFVMESVCRMLRRRIDEGKKVVTVSCNFSRHHFMRPGFSERFESILEKYQISKDLIEVEITETLVVEELQQNAIKKTIQELKEKGIRLSIDDFGSGYSSLGVFEQIPASVIKLDRSFLLNQEDRNRQIAIMRGIVHMAEDLDAQIVCEGVETNDDVELMREIGVYVAQGYRYSKPIPEEEFGQRLDCGIYKNKK